jgi:hypothetical protein
LSVETGRHVAVADVLPSVREHLIDTLAPLLAASAVVR